MKAIKYLGLGAFSAFCIVALNACSKTANSTATASNCVATTNGVGVNSQTGQSCVPNGLTGSYGACMTMSNGQAINTINGQACAIGTGGNVFTAPNGFTGQAYPSAAAQCAYYSAFYNTQYVPIHDQTGYACVLYSTFTPYASQLASTNYGIYGYDYYYAYPPEVDYGGGGGDCSTEVYSDYGYICVY